MFISPAFAQAAGAPAGPGITEMLLPIALIFAVFYFLLIRPQQKQRKQHQDMLSGVRRGDRIITNGGIIGTVNKVVNDAEVSVEIAEGVRVRVQRGMIATVLAKTEPAKDGGAKGNGGDGAKEGGKASSSPVAKLKGLLGGKG